MSVAAVQTPAAQETPKPASDPAVTPPAPAKVEPPVAAPAAPVEPAKVDPPVEPAKATEAPAAQKPVVPEKYDLKLPEGSVLDAKSVEKVSSYAKEKGLSNVQAQEILEREHSAVADFVNAQKAHMDEKVSSWQSALTSDAELGGEALKANAELSSRVVTRFGSDEFKKILKDTGLGNHPELVRVFSRIGKSMGDDQLVLPGSQPVSKRSHVDVLYGKTETKE